MKLHRYPFCYSVRILIRQWQKYTLPAFSLLLTALIVTLILSLTQSTSIYLEDQSKALVGGDAKIITSFPIDEESLLQGIPTPPTAGSQILDFNGTIRNTNSDDVLSASIDVVDQSFPLYGILELENSLYEAISADEILIDRAAAQKLSLTVGDTVSLGDVSYVVLDIITREPDALLNTFSIFPKVMLSKSGFARSGIDTSLLRAQYSYAYKFDALSEQTISYLQEKARENDTRLSLANDDDSRFSFGFDIIARFLIVAVLITALLAAVNVYASAVYLLDRLQQSIAVLRALGVPLRSIYSIVLLTFSYIAIGASVLGIFGGYAVATYARNISQGFLAFTLPAAVSFSHVLLVCLIVGATGVAALIPSLTRLSQISPRELLLGKTNTSQNKHSLFSLVSLTSLACIPLLLLASFLLKSILGGLVTIVSVIGVYVIISLIYRSAIHIIYRARHNFNFSLRSIISYKHHDGLFGIVSFTSLYVALTALFVLALTQTSLQSFLTNDIGATAPSVYMLDIQDEQVQKITNRFSDVTLFPSISGRILTIDDVDIQAALNDSSEDIDRELRREFTLTYRTNLIEGESIIAGNASIGEPGTVSVDEEFAQRANIAIGSRITVSIQGFPVTTQVTSLRETQSRNGLPFFYFVFSPEDLSSFPTGYFGYTYAQKSEQSELLNFVATTMPNVSVINTTEIGALIQKTVSLLLTIVLYIVLPPFILACALILVLIILQHATRRRDGARLLALGALPKWIQRQYVQETMSTTFLACIGAYSTATLATWYIATQYLELESFTLYNNQITYGLMGIFGGLFILGVVLWRSDKRPLREYLSYEDNR